MYNTRLTEHLYVFQITKNENERYFQLLVKIFSTGLHYFKY